MEKTNIGTALAVFFAALAIVFIAGLSLLTPTVTYGAKHLEGMENACPRGGELQEGQCVDEPLMACPEGFAQVGGGGEEEEGNPENCGKLIAQESPICPEGSTDRDEGEATAVCIDDVTGEVVRPECTTEDAILEVVEVGIFDHFACNIYEFTDERIIVGCNEGYTMNEEGQCVSRPGRMPTLPQ